MALHFGHMPPPAISLVEFPYADNLRVADLLCRGIPARALRGLASALGLTVPQLATAVMIPRRTLERRVADNALLKIGEAERAVRLGRLYAQAASVFEDPEAAAEWFSEPIPALGGKTPLELCATEPGAREVEQTLGRIEHGVFA